MGKQMFKEDVISQTITVLGSIKVPVAMKEEVADPIADAMRNLIIVLQMIEKEKEVGKDAGNKETDSE